MVLPARSKSLLVALGALAVSGLAAAQTAYFESAPITGAPVTISAELTRPDGSGPFPAVVLLHGCRGVWPPWSDPWTEKLVRWGYVVARVDSFSARGHADGICESPTLVDSLTRSADAHAARNYLKALRFVDGERIAVMGMSHGGTAVLSAVENTYVTKDPRPQPFKAAIALYPWCDQRLYRLDAPLLVLIGDMDDWTFAFKCERMALMGPTEHAVTLKVYSGATHGFDVDRPERMYLGHVMRFHPTAARDTEERVRAFLAKHLN